jgi:long-subunit fatty acid transport protein
MNDHEKQLFDEQHTGTIKGSNMIKDPADWKTGDEPMTGAQHSYMETLSAEAGETFDESLTKAAASKKIEDLQQRTGRGADPE